MMRRTGPLRIVILLIAVFWPAQPVHASMSGPCTATVNGQDVAARSASDPSDAIDVAETDVVSVAAQSQAPIGAYRIQLEYAGIRWTVAKGQATNDRWNRDVKVEDYSRYGAGLYRVHGVSDGATPCDGAVLINVDGNPLTTPVGLIAVGFVAVGLLNAFVNMRTKRGGATS